MSKTSKIRKVVNRYKAYKRYKNMLIKNNGQDYIKEYKFFEYGTLRELAVLRAESPRLFTLACALDRIILN